MKSRKKGQALFAVFAVLGVLLACGARADFNEKEAEAYATLSLKCMDRAYPYKFDHVYQSKDDVRTQKYFHPIFYGCFDWHSAAHGHWTLVRILDTFPHIAIRDEIIKRLDRHFQRANVETEVRYFERDKDTKRFERPYGYAWFLRLMWELRKSPEPKAREWVKTLEPLEKTIRTRFLEFLKVFDFPIRRGVHENSAFGLSHAYDYAKFMKDKEFLDAISATARKFYGHDARCPITYEPEGDDFISPCLTEADLMRRVLPHDEFLKWFDKFWPADTESVKVFFTPVVPTSIHDPKAIHLVGLDFEKAWTLAGIASALPDSDKRKTLFLKSSGDHARMGAELMEKGGYEGTHWLASFAVFQFTGANLH